MRKNVFGIALLTTVVASAAIGIDLGRQLFVDDWLVDSTQGIVRAYNHPTKAFDAPVTCSISWQSGL